MSVEFSTKGDAMGKFFEIIWNSQLFSGIEKEEIQEMLTCLDAKQKQFPKGDFIFRTGDSTDELGLLLTGTAFIFHNDFWGNRNILSDITPGQTFAETFACAPGRVMTRNQTAKFCF